MTVCDISGVLLKVSTYRHCCPLLSNAYTKSFTIVAPTVRGDVGSLHLDRLRIVHVCPSTLVAHADRPSGYDTLVDHMSMGFVCCGILPDTNGPVNEIFCTQHR